MPGNSGGGGTSSDFDEKKRRTSSTKTDAEAEGDKKLILMRPAVEMADDDPLHQDADNHHKQRAGDHGDDERAGIAVGDIAGVTAQHEHRAMREVEHAERAIDDGQSQQISASSAPSARPLKTCDTKFAQFTMLTASPRHSKCETPGTRHASLPRRRGHVELRYSRRACSRTRPASASAPRRARFRRCRSSLPCPSCPSAACP